MPPHAASPPPVQPACAELCVGENASAGTPLYARTHAQTDGQVRNIMSPPMSAGNETHTQTHTHTVKLWDMGGATAATRVVTGGA